MSLPRIVTTAALVVVSVQCVYGPSVTWGAKSAVGIAETDAGADGKALATKRKPKAVRKVTSAIW